MRYAGGLFVFKGQIMSQFLIAMAYSTPDSDRPSETGSIIAIFPTAGLFISANNVEEALQWAEVVRRQLQTHLTGASNTQYGHRCWHVDPPTKWEPLDRFQRIAVGEVPDLEKLMH